MLLPKLSVSITAMRMRNSVAWLVNQLDEIMRVWTEDKEKAKESEETLANEFLEKLVSIKENAASLQRDHLCLSM